MGPMVPTTRCCDRKQEICTALSILHKRQHNICLAVVVGEVSCIQLSGGFLHIFFITRILGVRVNFPDFRCSVIRYSVIRRSVILGIQSLGVQSC